MKTKLLVFVMTTFALLVGCRKKDCVVWFNPENENIVINTEDYINASDLAKKYNFYYNVAECDDSRLRELLEIDGKVINVRGCIRYNLAWESKSLYTLGERYDIPLGGHLMDSLPYDSTVYYVTGVARVFVFPETMTFKKDKLDFDLDTVACIFVEPIKYTIKEI